MSSLKSAITYIKCLQDLLLDCDAGKVGEEVFRKSLLLDENDRQKIKELKSVKRKPKTKNKTSKPKQAEAKTEKWTNYSETFVENKFGYPMHEEGFSDDVAPRNNQQSLQHEKAAVTESRSYPSSPVDVNEISLHISLLGSDRDMAMASHEGKVYYVCAVNEI